MEEFIKNKDAGGAKKNQKSAAENVVDSTSKRARQEGSQPPKNQDFSVHVHTHM